MCLLAGINFHTTRGSIIPKSVAIIVIGGSLPLACSTCTCITAMNQLVYRIQQGVLLLPQLAGTSASSPWRFSPT